MPPSAADVAKKMNIFSRYLLEKISYKLSKITVLAGWGEVLEAKEGGGLNGIPKWIQSKNN